MDYSSYSKAGLIERIEELEILLNQLLEEKKKESGIDFAWTGNLGHWYWNLKTNNVTFNPLKATTLGYSMDEIPEQVPFQFFTERLHPEDYNKTMEAMSNHLQGKAKVYEVEYRIKTKKGEYKWYYDRGSITKRDKDGRPLFLAGIVFDITEKKEMQLDLELKNRILSEQSSIDGLTQIKNHRAIIEHLKKEMDNSNINSQPVTVVMFDVDNFKNVNDTLGHLFGDGVLVEIARLIKTNIRETDLVGRYGGEEYMVVFSNTNVHDAAVISERIRQAVENCDFGHGFKITISGGVKQYSGEELSELINAADINLYNAKNSGKNRIVF